MELWSLFLNDRHAIRGKEMQDRLVCGFAPSRPHLSFSGMEQHGKNQQ